VFLDQPDVGEQALSKAAEIGLSTQLDEVENLAVDIRTSPLKLMQGELESVKIEGEGLVMKQDLRAEQLTVEVGNVAINPFKAAFGEIELTQATDASAQVVLTEQDIERAFNSEYIKNKLQNLPVTISGEPVTVSVRDVHFHLPGEQKVSMAVEILLVETGEIKQVAFTALPHVDANGQCVVLENVEYDKDKTASPELTAALLADASELLDLRNFNLKGMSLKIKQMNVQSGRIMLLGEAQIEQFPKG
jgi:hypothetical protein